MQSTLSYASMDCISKKMKTYNVSSSNHEVDIVTATAMCVGVAKCCKKITKFTSKSEKKNFKVTIFLLKKIG